MLQIWATRRYHWLAATSAFALVSIVLAGCVGQEDHPLDPYTVSTPEGFTAEIKFENGSEGTLSLQGPSEIPDVDYTSFSAYTLVEEAGEFKQTWYLDANYRVVAHVGNCRHGFAGPCDEYDNWNWLRQGELNPMGIGFPDLIKSDDFNMLSGGNVTFVEWESENLEDDVLHVTVQMPDYWKPEKVREETYEYAPGRLLPNSDTWHVLDYEAGKPLERADTLELPREPPQESSWQGLMFDGENEDHFEIGFSHREIVESAYPELGETTEICVKDYYLRLFDQSEENLLGVVPFNFGEDRIASAFVSVWTEGKEKTSEVEVYRDRFDGSVRIESSPFSSGSVKESCSDMYRSPWPSLNLTEGMEFVESLDISGELGVRMFNHHVGGQRMVFQEPEHGWHSWRFGFRPYTVGPGEAAIYTNYEVGFIPIESTPLRNALIHPDDISNFFREDA